jgi:hypothetical protein
MHGSVFNDCVVSEGVAVALFIRWLFHFLHIAPFEFNCLKHELYYCTFYKLVLFFGFIEMRTCSEMASFDTDWVSHLATKQLLPLAGSIWLDFCIHAKQYQQ